MSKDDPFVLSTTPGLFRSSDDVWEFLVCTAPRFTQPKKGGDWFVRTIDDLTALLALVGLDTPEDWQHLSEDDLIPLLSWMWGGFGPDPRMPARKVRARMGSRERVRC